MDRSGGDDLEGGIALLDGFVELGEAAVVAVGFVELVFVADLDVGEVEGFGVAVLCSLGSPPGGGAASDVFDLVKSVLNVGFKIGAGVDVVAEERVSGVDGEEWLHVEVFAPVEEFEEAEAVGRLVLPGAGVGGTVDERADGLLPVEALIDAISFKVIAAGEAEEGGVHGGEFFHEVYAEAIGAIFVGGWEEGDEAEPEGAGVLDGDFEVGGEGGFQGGGGFEGEGVLLPGGGERGDRSGGEDGGRIVVYQADGDGGGGVGFGVEGSAVGGGGTEGIAPEAVVGDAGVGLRSGGVDGELEAVREGGAGAGGLVGGDGGAGDALLDDGPVVEVGAAVVFEGAVVDHFGVEAAVVGVVDFFGHEAV